MAVRKQQDSVTTQGGPGEVSGPQVVNGLQTLLGGMLAKGPLGGAGMELVVNEEEISVVPEDTTAFSTKALLPANSILLGVTAKVTEEILDEVYSVGGISIAGEAVLDEEFMIDDQGFVFKRGRAGRGWIDGVASLYAFGYIHGQGDVQYDGEFTISDQTFAFKPVRAGVGEVTAGSPSAYATSSFFVNAYPQYEDTFTIGAQTWTFKPTRTGAGEVGLAASDYAKVIVMLSSNPALNATIEIAGQVFTFVALRSGLGEVTRGAYDLPTSVNLAAAINLDLPGVVTAANELPGGAWVHLTSVVAGLPGEALTLVVNPSYGSAGGNGGFQMPQVSTEEAIANVIAAVGLDSTEVEASVAVSWGSVDITALLAGPSGALALASTPGDRFKSNDDVLSLPTAPLSVVFANMVSAVTEDLAGVVTAALVTAEGLPRMNLTAVDEGLDGELDLSADAFPVSGDTLLLPVMDTATLRTNIITAINADLAGRVVATEGVEPSDIVLTSAVSGTPGTWVITYDEVTNITFADFELASGVLLWALGDENTADRFGADLENAVGTEVVYTGHWNEPAFEQEDASSIGITTAETPFTGKVMATVFALVFRA